MIALLATAAAAAELRVTVRERGAAGGPVAGARVSAGGDVVVTGADGVAVLSAPDGPWTVTVAAPGFADTTASGSRPEVTIWLRPGGPAELEVVVEGLRLTADPTRYAVDGEQATETPGTFEDAVRLVQSLPGVAIQREFAPSSGDLSIRGSTAADNRVYLDGVEIPYLYHFNQYASVFPTSQIATLEMYPSTFSARYGDAVGAVVEARSHDEVPEAVRGSVHGNLVTVGGDVATPVGSSGTWVSVAARRSYQDLAGEASPQYQIWPRFHDAVARVERRGVGLFAFTAGDRWSRALGELDVLDAVEAEASPRVAFGQHFEGVGLRTRRARDGGPELRTALGVVHFVRDAAVRPPDDGPDLGAERFDSVTASSRGDAAWRFGDDRGEPQGLEAGWEVSARDARYRVDEAPPDAARAAREAPGLARGVPVDARLLRLQAAGYGTARFAFGALALAPGVRAGADSAGGGPLVDPRLGVRLPLSDGFMLKAALGRYSQRPDAELVLAAPELPTTRATEGSLGFESALAGRMEVALDAYAKELDAPVLVPVDAAPSAADRGSALGVELVTRYRIREIVFLWGWLAVQRARFVTEGAPVPAPGDQRVSGGLVLSIDAGGWNLGARYRGASGLPFTPLDGSIYDAGRDQWVAVPGPTNGARLPAYHKVDLHAAYTWALRGWSLTLTGELWVVPRSAAALYPTWSYDYSEQGWVRGPTALPLVGARASF